MPFRSDAPAPEPGTPSRARALALLAVPLLVTVGLATLPPADAVAGGATRRPDHHHHHRQRRRPTTTTRPRATTTTRPRATTTAPPPTTPATTTPPPTTAPPVPGGRWLLAYYAGYQRDLMPPEEVEWSSMTHVVVTRVVPRADGTLDESFDIDPTTGPVFARDLTARARANHVVPILMVGGAGTHDEFAAALSPTSRDRFARSLVDTARRLGFSGLDLDLEPITTTDEAPLEALVDAIRRAAPDLALTVPVGWTSTTFPQVSSFYGRLAAKVDRINVMTYGMAGAWDGWRSWHGASLDATSPSTPTSVAVSARSYLAAGVPRAKLGVGAAFSGQCWAPAVTGPNQELRGSDVIASDNTMSYTHILEAYADSAAYRYDTAAEAPYLGFTVPHGPEGCTFVSYEDPRSLAAKGRWAAANGVGAVIVWTANQGHQRGAPAGRRDALLAGLRGAFGA